jgi:hypothetical protein
MPIQHNTAFDPEAVTALTAAYQSVCLALGLIDRTDPLTQIVAKKIMQYATSGERDPIQLREIVLSDLKACAPLILHRHNKPEAPAKPPV